MLSEKQIYWNGQIELIEMFFNKKQIDFAQSA